MLIGALRGSATAAFWAGVFGLFWFSHGVMLAYSNPAVRAYAWVEIVLDEGRNRQIRRLLDAFDIATLRLIRVAIGGLTLGDLPKGEWRALTEDDLQRLRG